MFFRKIAKPKIRIFAYIVILTSCAVLTVLAQQPAKTSDWAGTLYGRYEGLVDEDFTRKYPNWRNDPQWQSIKSKDEGTIEIHINSDGSLTGGAAYPLIGTPVDAKITGSVSASGLLKATGYGNEFPAMKDDPFNKYPLVEIELQLRRDDIGEIDSKGRVRFRALTVTDSETGRPVRSSPGYVFGDWIHTVFTTEAQVTPGSGTEEELRRGLIGLIKTILQRIKQEGLPALLGSLGGMLAAAVLLLLSHIGNQPGEPVENEPTPVEPEPVAPATKPEPVVKPSPTKPEPRRSRNPCQAELETWRVAHMNAMSIQRSLELFRGQVNVLELQYNAIWKAGTVDGIVEVGALAGSLIYGAIEKSAAKALTKREILKRIAKAHYQVMVKNALKSFVGGLDPTAEGIIDDLAAEAAGGIDNLGLNGLAKTATGDTSQKTAILSTLEHYLTDWQMRRFAAQGGLRVKGPTSALKKCFSPNLYNKLNTIFKQRAFAIADFIGNIDSIARGLGGNWWQTSSALDQLRPHISKLRQRIFELEQEFKDARYEVERFQADLNSCKLSRAYERYLKWLAFQKLPKQG